jgi:hypothetical protein
MSDISSKPKISGKKHVIQRRSNGTFLPGVSPNPKGRPVGSADPLKEIAKRIGEARIAMRLSAKRRRELAKIGIQEEGISIIEAILLDWAISDNVAKQEKFVERYGGKVANVNVNQNSTFDFMKHADKFTDAELEAIKNGADPLDILFSKLPVADDDNTFEDTSEDT